MTKAIKKTPTEKQSVSKKVNGGARPGSGRKKGVTNKISGTSIIAALEKHLGVSYEEQLALNYAVCQRTDDRVMIAKYDQLFLSKVVGDLTNLELTGEVKQTIINISQSETGQYK